MAKSLHSKSNPHSKSNLSTLSKTNLPKKYTCGCGKTYTSYPAFSTHRKTKHNNQDVQGTYIPKFQNPKRGRPTYEFVKKSQGKMHQIHSYYQGLTVIQLGLVKLNELFSGKIISESHETNTFSIPDDLVTISSNDSAQTKGENFNQEISNLQHQILKTAHNSTQIQFLSKLLVLFIELMTTHMTQKAGKALISFVTEFLLYLASLQNDSVHNNADHYQKSKQNSENQESSQSQGQGEDFEDGNSKVQMIEMSMFNDYFSRQENKEQINKLSAQYELSPQFFFTICVILSHWMYKLGYCDKVIKTREPLVPKRPSVY